MKDHDTSKSDDATVFDQVFGFVGAVGFLALLVYAQSQL
jgi:hypothetical protein